jgi:transcriptional regulator with XRE-family HTH domain
LDREASIEREIGERLRRRRVELGLTQDQLGQVIGVSYQQIQKFERGANRISAARLLLLAERLEIDVGHLYGIGPIGTDRATEADALTNERAVLDVLRHFQRIDDGGVRSAIAGLVRSVTEHARPSGESAGPDQEVDQR